jgi:hypothetical protein
VLDAGVVVAVSPGLLVGLGDGASSGRTEYVEHANTGRESQRWRSAYTVGRTRQRPTVFAAAERVVETGLFGDAATQKNGSVVSDRFLPTVDV